MTLDRIRSTGFGPAKQWAFLARARTMRVASLNADGSIHLTPVWFVTIGERLFIVDDATPHRDNFEAGRAFSAVVDEGDDYRSLHGLRIQGEVRPVAESELVERIPQLVLEKYFYVGHPHLEAYVEFGQWAGRRNFEIVPTIMTGWDAREETHPQGRERRRFPRPLSDRLHLPIGPTSNGGVPHDASPGSAPVSSSM